MPREATRKVITDTMVQKVKPAPKGKRVEYWDAIVPGFGLRVTDTGSKSFFLRKRIDTEQVRMSWSYPTTSLEAARIAAKSVLEDLANGINPKTKQEEEERANKVRLENTFKSIAERFMVQHVDLHLAPCTKLEYKWALFGKDVAKLQNRPVDSITRPDVREILDAILDSGRPSSANKMRAYLSKFFNWCAERDLLEHVPTDRIKPPAPKVVGERTLNEAEIKLVWAAFDAEGDVFGDLFKLLLLTGQRRSEVAGIRQSELTDLDGEKPSWQIPSNRTKNGRPHVVSLSKPVVEILKNRPVIGDEGLLLTTTGNTGVTGFSKAKKHVDAWIKAKLEKEEQRPMPDWDLHDLRRTMVTMMNDRLGIAPHIVEACVNHISGGAKAGIAGVYNKAMYMDGRKEAFEAWAWYLKSINYQGGEMKLYANFL
jgi:integrase